MPQANRRATHEQEVRLRSEDVPGCTPAAIADGEANTTARSLPASGMALARTDRYGLMMHMP